MEEQISTPSHVMKRNGEVAPFDEDKISTAVLKAAGEIGEENKIEIVNVVDEVISIISDRDEESPTPTVDEIHKAVEDTLMDMKYFDLARTYIGYRESHKPDIFKKRIQYKPFEYPQFQDYVDAIRQSYWLVEEFNYNADIQNFKSDLTEKEQSVVKNAMLAISQIEAYSVKTFWGKVYDRMPKPEIADVGATFAESESRHASVYSHLLEILGLNEEFKHVTEIPAIKERMEYLSDFVSPDSKSDQEYMQSVLLFSMFIENVSLFGQFLIISSFDKEKNMLKGIGNAIQATSLEEECHSKFGAELISILRQEKPSWFTKELEQKVHDSCLRSFESEKKVIEWIFEKGDLDFISKYEVIEYIKDRFNRSMEMMGFSHVFVPKKECLDKFKWFDIQMKTTTHVDFFAKRSTSYTKMADSYTEDDLF